MQNKGVIKLLAILLGVFTLYQLSFTFVTKRIENKADTFAKSEESERLANDLAQGNQDAFNYYWIPFKMQEKIITWIP